MLGDLLAHHGHLLDAIAIRWSDRGADGVGGGVAVLFPLARALPRRRLPDS